jgi:hypothetical protein
MRGVILVKRREEVLNVTIARILTTYGLPAEPEIIVSEKLPDVRIVIGGLKVILEGKSQPTRRLLEKQARERLETGLADISIALVYPAELFQVGTPGDLDKKMADSKYAGTIYCWSKNGIASNQFNELGIKELVELLNHVLAIYIRNDLLATKISEIEAGITKLTGEGQQRSLVFYSKAVEDRLRKALGIGEEDGEEEQD